MRDATATRSGEAPCPQERPVERARLARAERELEAVEGRKTGVGEQLRHALTIDPVPRELVDQVGPAVGARLRPREAGEQHRGEDDHAAEGHEEMMIRARTLEANMASNHGSDRGAMSAAAVS